MMLIQHSVNSDWLFNAQSSVLQTVWFILKINQKSTLSIKYPLLIQVALEEDCLHDQSERSKLSRSQNIWIRGNYMYVGLCYKTSLAHLFDLPKIRIISLQVIKRLKETKCLENSILLEIYVFNYIC